MATIRGKWVLNNPVVPYDSPTVTIFENVSFDIGGHISGITHFDDITVAPSSPGYCVLFEGGIAVCDGSGKWVSGVKYWDGSMDFGDTPQTVSDEFYTWYVANAIPQCVYIAYNGTETAIEAGQAATLASAGKVAVSNIVVVFGVAGTITYNGTETAVSAGQTAAMECSGKKMLSDVVVAL